MSTKKEQRALKRPDLFQARGREYLEKLKQSPQTLVIVFGIIVLSIGGFFLSQYYTNQQLEQRSSELWEADKLFEKELTSLQDTIYDNYKKMNDLDVELRALKEDKAAEKKNKTQIEKLEKEISALEETTKNFKVDHSGSNEAYLAFFNKHPKTAEGTRAAIQVIHYLTQEKSYLKAEELSEKVLDNLSPTSFFYTSLLKLRIKLLSETSKLDVALSEADKLLASSSEKEQPQAMILKGNLLLQAKKQEEAEKIFDTVITHFHATGELKSQARAFKALIF